MSIDKFLAWIRRHWLLTIIISFVGLVLITHILFKINLGLDFISAEWSASDFLGYIAGFYTFIGTILLGTVTVDQSKKAQKVNEQLSKENNFFQKVSVQKSVPIKRIASILVEAAKNGSYSIDALGGKAIVRGSVSTEQRAVFVDVVLPNTVSEGLQVKVITLSLENISDGVIRQIAVEKINFSGFLLCGEQVAPVSCCGDEKYKFISDLLLPHEQLEIKVRIYYSDVRYTQFWEFKDNHSIGEFNIYLYLKNTSISDIVCQEKIYIEKADGMKEKIVYRTFGEEQQL